MIINGIDCGDEFELSREEFAVLLKMIRERMKEDADRKERHKLRELNREQREREEMKFIGWAEIGR